MHCHVSPPDASWDVSRGVAETVALANAQGLDFVVLTPHVPARFFADPAGRRVVLEGQETLRAALAREPSARTLFIPGMEYTDHRWGHVGASFADLGRVLDDVPAAEAAAHPERFFQRFVARGGLLVVNHPLVTPLQSVFPIARADLSWRPFTAPGPYPAEIAAVNALSQALEVYNEPATELRDRFLLGDSATSIVATLARMDREIAAQRRRIVPVGGSDTHVRHLSATTFVLAEGRSEEALREALLAGRVCVRSAEACSLEARPARDGAPWVGLGGAVRGDAAEVRARGGDAQILVDGVPAARPLGGGATRVRLDPGRCSVIRARVGDGYSAPIYANCDFQARG